MDRSMALFERERGFWFLAPMITIAVGLFVMLTAYPTAYTSHAATAILIGSGVMTGMAGQMRLAHRENWPWRSRMIWIILLLAFWAFAAFLVFPAVSPDF